VESLAIIGLLDPPVELLLLGSGDRARRPCEKLAAHFRAMGIVVEQTNTVVFLCVLYRPQTLFYSKHIAQTALSLPTPPSPSHSALSHAPSPHVPLYISRLSSLNRPRGITAQLSAIGTFNILNGEDRLVAAALVHPGEGDSNWGEDNGVA